MSESALGTWREEVELFFSIPSDMGGYKMDGRVIESREGEREKGIKWL